MFITYIIIWLFMFFYSFLFYFFEKWEQYSKRREIKSEFKKIRIMWEKIDNYIWYQFSNNSYSASMNWFIDQNWKNIYFIQLPFWFSFKEKLHSFYLFHELWHICIIKKLNKYYKSINSILWRNFRNIFFLFFFLTFLSIINLRFQFFEFWRIVLPTIFANLSIVFWSIHWLYLIIEEIFANIYWYQLMKDSKYKIKLWNFLFFSSIWLFSYITYFYVSFLPYFLILMINK